MNLDEFLAWASPPGQRWQLVDGEPVSMAPASRTHGALQAELAYRIARHLDVPGNPCTVVTAPGIVPRVRARENFRIPDLGVSCSRYDAEEYGIADPILLIEILSPSNAAETWANVWTYTTLPSVREILRLSSTARRAEILRRAPDDIWPAEAEVFETGDLRLDSIDFTVPLADLYRTTRLAIR